MLNSVATGRRLALRIVLVQLLVAIAVALLFLAQGTLPALAAGTGGCAVVAGSLVMALRSFGRATVSANAALLRLLAGMALKTIVLLAIVYLGLVRFGLPPVPLLVGVAATSLSFLFAARLNA